MSTKKAPSMGGKARARAMTPAARSASAKAAAEARWHMTSTQALDVARAWDLFSRSINAVEEPRDDLAVTFVARECLRLARIFRESADPADLQADNLPEIP